VDDITLYRSWSKEIEEFLPLAARQEGLYRKNTPAKFQAFSIVRTLDDESVRAAFLPFTRCQ